jgi:hypothetical protein
MPQKAVCIIELMKTIETLSLNAWAGETSEYLAEVCFKAIQEIAKSNAYEKKFEEDQPNLF